MFKTEMIWRQHDLKQILKQSIILCLFYILLSSYCNAAVITLSNGESLEASNLSYVEGQLYFNEASATKLLDRREIRDISFSGTTQKKEISSSDAGDLGNYVEKAKELAKKYPDATSILVYSERNHSHSHRGEGINVTRYRAITYVAKEEALWAAQVSISFDPNREKVKILHARSLASNGEIHNLQPEQIKISKDSSGSVHFNNEQSISFSIPEVGVGSLVDYCYEVEEYNPFDADLFSGRCYLQFSRPVGETVLRVSVPIDHKLNYLIRNFPEASGTPVIVEAIDSIVYTWKISSDMPPIISEPRMPPFRDIAPCIYYSLHKDHQYMHSKLKPMYEKRFELTDDVKAKVDQLVKDCKNLEEKIAKLYYFCQQEIRYISIKSNLASNQVGHSADETLKNKYGDCTDKGMLLAVMLKHIGIEAYPVLVLTNTAGKSVRDLGIFDDNHCITEIHLDGRIFYLDATATDFRYPYLRSDDHEANARNVILGTQKTVPLPPPEDNATISNRKLRLEADGTTHIDVEATYNGPTESSHRERARNLKPEEYEKMIRRSISAQTADYILEVATHSNPLDFTTQYRNHTVYTLNRFAPKSGKYMIFSVPYFELSFPEVSLAKRKYGIQHRTSSLNTEHLSIKLPKGYSVKYLPPALRVQSPYVEFEVIYDQQGDQIDITRKLAFPRRYIPVEDYEAYKADLEKIAHYSKKQIFLEEMEPNRSKTDTKKTQPSEITNSNEGAQK